MLQAHTGMPGSYMGFGKPNSGPHAYIAGTLNNQRSDVSVGEVTNKQSTYPKLLLLQQMPHEGQLQMLEKQQYSSLGSLIG